MYNLWIATIRLMHQPGGCNCQFQEFPFSPVKLGCVWVGGEGGGVEVVECCKEFAKF